MKQIMFHPDVQKIRKRDSNLKPSLSSGLIFRYSWCRTAARFLALHGVPRLAALLAQERAPAAAVRYAAAACEALALSSGCAGLEAMLGWWRPPPPQLEEQVRQLLRLNSL